MWRRAIVMVLLGFILALGLSPHPSGAYSLAVTIPGYGTIPDNGTGDLNPAVGIIDFNQTLTDFTASGRVLGDITGVTLTSAYIVATSPGVDVYIGFGVPLFVPPIDPPFWVGAHMDGQYINDSGTIGSAQVTLQPVLLSEYNGWVPPIVEPAVNNVTSPSPFDDQYLFFNGFYSMDQLWGELHITLGSAGDGIYLPDSAGITAGAVPAPPTFLLMLSGLISLGGFSLGRKRS